MIKYLFDTNILSSLIKQPHSPLAHKIIELDADSFCTSIIVACELRYGAKKKGSKELIKKVDLLLDNIFIAPLGPGVDYHYAALRTALEKKGQPISAHDMLIAAHALALDAVLVTANMREFNRAAGLTVENWLISANEEFVN